MALGEGKFDERGARIRRGQAASGNNRRRDRIESITAWSRCRSKAALNGVILSSASLFDEKFKKKKKTKKKLASGMREISLEESDERR
jgi:hypothetical protein